MNSAKPSPRLESGRTSPNKGTAVYAPYRAQLLWHKYTAFLKSIPSTSTLRSCKHGDERIVDFLSHQVKQRRIAKRYTFYFYVTMLNRTFRDRHEGCGIKVSSNKKRQKSSEKEAKGEKLLPDDYFSGYVEK